MNAVPTAQLVQGMDPGVGTVNLNPDGSFSFSAGPNFQGEADFTYGLVQGGNQIGEAVGRIRSQIAIANSIALIGVAFGGNATIPGGASANARLIDANAWQWYDENGNGMMDFGDQHSPISFTACSYIQLRPTFRITSDASDSWRVRATSQVFNDGFQLRIGYSQTIRLFGFGFQTTSGLVQMDNCLPDFTDYYPSLDLTWQLSPDNGQTWITPAVASTSSNQTFITLDNPRGWNPDSNVEKPNISQTVFYAGVWGSVGATTQNQLVSYVFSGFQSRTISRARMARR